MATQHVHVDGVSFRSVFPAQRIVGAAAAALRPPRIAVALLALAIVMVGGGVWDTITVPRVSPIGIQAGVLSDGELAADRAIARQAAELCLGGAATDAPDDALIPMLAEALAAMEGADDPDASACLLRAIEIVESRRPLGMFESVALAVRVRGLGFVGDAITLEWSDALEQLYALVVLLPIQVVNASPVFAGWMLLVVSLANAMVGIVLARMNAFDLSPAEAPDFADARRWTQSNRSTAGLLLIVPIVGVMICLALASIPSILSWVPLVDAVAGVLFGVSFVFGIVAVIVASAGVLGVPFLLPLVACDGADAVEASQRSLASIFARPLHFVMHLVLAAVAVVLAVAAADVVVSCGFDGAVRAWATVHDTPALQSLGRMEPFVAWRPNLAVHLSGWEQFVAWILGFWRLVASALIGAAAISAIVAACTRAWLLQRLAADGRDPADVSADRPVAG